MRPNALLQKTPSHPHPRVWFFSHTSTSPGWNRFLQGTCARNLPLQSLRRGYKSLDNIRLPSATEFASQFTLSWLQHLRFLSQRCPKSQEAPSRLVQFAAHYAQANSVISTLQQTQTGTTSTPLHLPSFHVPSGPCKRPQTKVFIGGGELFIPESQILVCSNLFCEAAKVRTCVLT